MRKEKNTRVSVSLPAKFIITLLVLSYSTSIAQLCSGSLGDPIVNIDFGKGSGRGAALGTSITAYSYSSGSDLGEGVYTIANSTSGLKSNAWHVTADHTGNGNGYMMVVNSATLNSEGVFYKKVVNGLCAGTTYEFSAWLINIMNPSAGTDQYHPNITFRVSTNSGAVLGTYKTGDIAQTSSPEWKQYGFYFTTGTATEVIITVLNSAPSARPGNDLALDDITFRACGATMKASIKGTPAANSTVCIGGATALALNAEIGSGYNNPTLQWQVSTSSGWKDVDSLVGAEVLVNLAKAVVGTYCYRLAASEGVNNSSTNCRVYSNQLCITVQENPVASFEKLPGLACAEHAVSFTNTSSSGSKLNYLWQFGDGTSSTEQNPVHAYKYEGSYIPILNVSTESGCSSSFTLAEPIVVNEIPVAGFTISPTDTSIYFPYVEIWMSSYNNSSCSINWGDNSQTGCSIYTHTYNQPGTYTVTQLVSNSIGCFNEHKEIVTIRDEFSVYIPNAFSPNGDGLNDVFLPVANAVSHYTFLIFDRWGHVVFESADPTLGWDGFYKGIACAKGIYAYKLSLKDDVTEQFHVYAGKVLLYQWDWEDQY